MQRGVTGDPEPWSAATRLEPTSLAVALAHVPSTIQERWFGRLFLMKLVMVGCLALFWIVSGAIALVSFGAAAGVLVSRGFPARVAHGVTLVSSLADIAVGLAVAHRRICAAGLLAGIACPSSI